MRELCSVTAAPPRADVGVSVFLPFTALSWYTSISVTSFSSLETTKRRLLLYFRVQVVKLIFCDCFCLSRLSEAFVLFFSISILLFTLLVNTGIVKCKPDIFLVGVKPPFRVLCPPFVF
jgi:hypothetical protein